MTSYENSKRILDEKFRPSTLAACRQCKFLKNVSKVSSTQMCQNCGESKFTKNFYGMVCINSPQKSWVSSYLKLQQLAPGLYALSLGQNDNEPVQETTAYDDYDDDDVDDDI